MSDELFRQRLKKLRSEKGMTLEELANLIGTTKTTLSRYENGERSPKLQLVGALANYFNVEMAWLSGMENTTNVSAKKHQTSDSNIIEENSILQIDKKIAELIKDTREKKQLSLKNVSEKMNISESEILAYEEGSSTFTVPLVFQFAQALDVTFDDLFPTTTTDHFDEIPAILNLDEKTKTITTSSGKQYVVDEKEFKQAQDFIEFLGRK
ncbi:helix-turn-helix domain-containing protein [Enterococcus avium]|uniref:helix-turn-helix domain-containing protein n=1 Tax=Enterococcus avium TaxID=33945 RepID=UPI001F589217|nr:helix-turn-helix transcriptional regulator [Enterococcus avium]